MNIQDPLVRVPRKSKHTPLVLAVVCVVAIVVFIAAALYISGQKSSSTKLVLGSGSSKVTYKLEKVTETQDQTKGLSGRDNLAKDAGMLFTYTGVTQRCMWMKDMRFNLDIIWLDADNRITSIVPNLTPATYPQSYCADAQSVVEINAGQAATLGLRAGQIVKF